MWGEIVESRTSQSNRKIKEKEEIKREGVELQKMFRKRCEEAFVQEKEEERMRRKRNLEVMHYQRRQAKRKEDLKAQELSNALTIDGHSSSMGGADDEKFEGLLEDAIERARQDGRTTYTLELIRHMKEPELIPAKTKSSMP